MDDFLILFGHDLYRTFMRVEARPLFAKGRMPVTSIDPSDQQPNLLCLMSKPSANFFAGNCGRLLLLAVVGFFTVRLALALLQLS